MSTCPGLCTAAFRVMKSGFQHWHATVSRSQRWVSRRAGLQPSQLSESLQALPQTLTPERREDTSVFSFNPPSLTLILLAVPTSAHCCHTRMTKGAMNSNFQSQSRSYPLRLSLPRTASQATAFKAINHRENVWGHLLFREGESDTHHLVLPQR